MEKRKKILIMPLPAQGHVNPLTGLARELALKEKYDVIFYGNPEHRDLIIRTGASFRQYFQIPSSSFKYKPLDQDKYDVLQDFFTELIELSYNVVPILVEEIEDEKPDLVVYDLFSFHARYALRLIQDKFKKSHTRPPLTVNFYPCFANKQGVYPSDEQIKEIGGSVFGMLTTLIRLVYKQTKLSWYFGTNIYNPLNLIYNQHEVLNIVSVFPELHPCSNEFDSSFKFVGSCALESVRKTNDIEPKVKQIIDLFKPLNPNFELKQSSQTKLIYVSLGTVFNNNKFIFDLVIDSIWENNRNPKYELKVIMAVGRDNYLKYQTENLPENVILVETAPQIEILERASLFITHCGMNSAMEAIQYGVPVICLPIKSDQPLVAQRLADELKLGLRFDPLKMTSTDIKQAIETILDDRSYLERILDLCKTSAKYNGSKVSADLVQDYLENFYYYKQNQINKKD